MKVDAKLSLAAMPSPSTAWERVFRRDALRFPALPSYMQKEAQKEEGVRTLSWPGTKGRGLTHYEDL
jgi:hypothetical protein